MLAHLAVGGRCATLSALPRANTLAIIRKASSSGGSKKHEEPVAVSTPTGSDPNSSPMSQRALPPDDGKVRFPNPWDVILNKRRFEYAMKFKGYDDPFDMMPVKRIENSSAENPNLLPSCNDKRLMACICNEDVYHLKWMHLHRGEPKRCYCGHWFKLTERQFVDLSDFGITEDMQKPAAH
ncbi:unnamed protein product [Rotaria socialis]|uniref:Uncharacterized protein n=1 Tax=Rotaria socialis TaxID=392032 RepID=A0A820C5D8_9BILA|nr:unnamed protein product [Rotaria socialis]CAF3429528.1 unnamed protein product [Rotaria socialis]CAF3593407.1 unnamed protein product [Rotaria socialis]CAF4216949.1 unnamed protein product [Rotaria socialis]CAF4503834.1 unnamed protein product [Rotaria socialis]